jgi:hypothetical protein
MVDHRLFESRFIMAASAIALNLAFMGVRRMTIPAKRPWNLAQFAVVVAALTFQALVFAPEGIFGFAMIRNAGLPRRFVMALRTGLPERRIMLIAMAIRATGEFQPGPLFPGMTFLTGQILMGPRQAIGRALMVEPNLLEGDLHGMAGLAALAKLAPMDVLMTCGAPIVFEEIGGVLFGRQGRTGIVAFLTISDGGVLPHQGISGFRMLEFLRLPLD